MIKQGVEWNCLGGGSWIGPPLMRAALGVFAAAALYLTFGITPAYVSFISAEAVDHPLTTRMLFWIRLGTGTAGVAALAGAIYPRFYRILTSEAVIFALPLVSLAYFAALKADLGLLNRLYIFLVHEDGLLEFLSFFLFLGAALISVGSVVYALRARLRIVGFFHLGLAAFLMFVALEEISYGQRIIQFQTPEDLVAINRQEEFNFHNIRAIEWFTLAVGPLLVSLYGTLGWAASLILQAVVPREFVERERLTSVFPPWYLATFFLPLAAFSLVALYFREYVPFWVSQDQELAEFYLSAGFLLSSIAILWDLPAGRRGAAGLGSAY